MVDFKGHPFLRGGKGLVKKKSGLFSLLISEKMKLCEHFLFWESYNEKSVTDENVRICLQYHSLI